MSKVKRYMDSNNTKARHRNRIDETRRTKANRIRKCKNDTYSWIRGGYYHVTERNDIPVSILKRGSTRRAKFLKTQAKRRFRRNVNVSKEDYCLLKGNTYRKDYDIEWSVW